MLRGLAADTSGIEVPPVTGGCGDNFDYTYKFSDASGSFIGGGFMGGMSAWFTTPTTDRFAADAALRAAAIAAGQDPDLVFPTSRYSTSGALANLGANFTAIFDTNAWLCDPTYQIGHIVPPLAVLLLVGLSLKRGRR